MDLRSRFAAAGLATRADQAAALARPCIRLRSTPGEDPLLPVGASKIGGEPDLPASFAWPAWKGAPLSFLAQVDLAELAPFATAAPLPRSGLLSFFYDAEQETAGFDPADRGSWRVVHFASGVPLERRAFPDELPPYGRYLPCAAEFAEDLSLAPFESAEVEGLRLTEEEMDAYCAVLDEWPPDAEGPWHQMLGHPQPIQGEMQLECQLASSGIDCGGPEGYADPRRAELEPGAASWRLLLQLDTDDDAEMMWGDVGRLYFWIREEDLARADFDHVWMVLQCS